MPRDLRSFLIWASAMAVVAALAAGALTAMAVHNNSQSEFCVFLDGRLVTDASGDCVLRFRAVAGRFLLYYCFTGGALVGPFGLYAILYGIRTVFGPRPGKPSGADGRAGRFDG